MGSNHLPAKVLIVDDEESVRDLLAEVLSDDLRECTESPSAFDALNKLKNLHFDLVISDVAMPGMSGVELLHYAKKQDNSIGFIMVTGLADLTTAVDSLRMGAFDFIAKPFDILAIRRATDRALEHRRLVTENRYYQEQLQKKIRERTLELNEALHDLEESYKITLEALVTALDAREHETRAHSMRVREYTLRLSKELGLTDDALTHAGRGALLHDVGKIGVPDSILLKPGSLTEAEWLIMKKHPQIGYDILAGIQFLAPAAEIVLCHQEKWDGTGYPNRLRGNDIPLAAQIFAVVDTLDAMTSDRPYRKAVSFQAAMAEIKRCSGTQFAPHVVDAFLGIGPESWMCIHDSVNRLHRGQDCCDILCRT